MQNYEEHVQKRINEIWTKIQQKQEDLLNEFQNELEQIIEDCAMIKYEKMAIIKFTYKGDERDAEIEAVKKEMEELKD
jgi:hypothetical protein